MQTLLIFPAVTPEAREYYRRAKSEGKQVIAAASVTTDRSYYDQWEHLPSVNEATFPDAFNDLVRRYGIDTVFVPVASAHFFLKKFLASQNSTLQIVNASPFDTQALHYAELLKTVELLLPLERSIAQGNSQLSRNQIAAILRQALGVHGESNEEKLVAMMGMFSRAPQGDIVEIGTLMGRTAIVMRLLADHYNRGPVLTVDPWGETEAIQHDSPDFVQDMAHVWKPGVLKTGFTINMLQLGAKNHAHIELASTNAHEVYVTSQTLPDLSGKTSTTFSHKIAVLHIDANHDYNHVQSDWAHWGAHLVPGGWVIFDDYVWLHGDGPKRVADELLESHLFDESFSCGKALFCRLATGHSSP